MRFTRAKFANFRQEPWGKDGRLCWKADVELPGRAAELAGCLGRLFGAEDSPARPPFVGTAVLEPEVLGDWFWEESCREVSVALSNDLHDALDQHRRRLDAGKPGL